MQIPKNLWVMFSSTLTLVLRDIFEHHRSAPAQRLTWAGGDVAVQKNPESPTATPRESHCSALRAGKPPASVHLQQWDLRAPLSALIAAACSAAGSEHPCCCSHPSTQRRAEGCSAKKPCLLTNIPAPAACSTPSCQSRQAFAHTIRKSKRVQL